MKLFVPKELSDPRVALSPESAKKISAFGFEVTVEKGAGDNSHIPDGTYKDAGAKICTLKRTRSGLQAQFLKILVRE